MGLRSAAKKTPAEWRDYLIGPGAEARQFTLEEYQTGCLALLLGHMIPTREATEGTEGVIRRVDEFLAMTGERAGIPYPRGPVDREALTKAREANSKQLEGGDTDV